MRICGFAAEVLRNERRLFETFPSKELQDYWSNRPKYEEVPVQAVAPGPSSAGVSSSGPSGSLAAGGPEASGGKPGGGAGEGQSYEEWLAAQSEEKEEAPPPPYSLEAEEVPATVPAAANASTTTAASPSAVPAHSSVSAPTPTSVAVNPAAGAVPSVPSSHASAPPGINTSTYPAQQPHGTGYGPPDPVASLANDLGRASLSQPGSSQPASPGAFGTSFSPPPLHPAHPAASGSSQGGYNGYGKANSNPGSRPNSSAGPGRPYPQPNMATHPSTSQSPHGYSSALPQHQQQPPRPQEPNTPGPWSQSQWPPPEWKINNSSPQNTPYPVYNPSGGAGGANLSRPHTYSAGHHSAPSGGGGAHLKPSATICGGASTIGAGGKSYNGPSVPSLHTGASPGPSFPGVPGAGPGAGPSFPMGPGGLSGPGLSPYPSPLGSSYPGQRPTSPYPPTSPAAGGHGVSTYPGQQTSTYPGQQTSTYPGQQTSTYPGQQQTFPSYPTHHNSSPQSPSVGQISYPSTTTDLSSGGPAGYYQAPLPHSGPAHPHPPHNTPSPQPPSTNGPPGMQFPHGSGEYGHGPGSMGGPMFPSGPQGGYGGYPPQHPHGQPGTPYGQQGGPAFPPAGTPGPWMAGPGGTPPAIPPREFPPVTLAQLNLFFFLRIGPNTSTRPSSSGPNFPVASTTGQQAIGFALSAVDKVAGKKTREQLEAAGTKLFGRFK